MTTDCPIEDLERLPGLYRPWELPEVLTTGVHYRIEEAGQTGTGDPLLAVYRGASFPARWSS